MTEAGKRTHPKRHLWRAMAAWSVGSLVIGVLVGRYLKEVSEDYPLVDPGTGSAPKSPKPRNATLPGRTSNGR